MATYRELIYQVLDNLKIGSDDSYFTEDHISFLINNYRMFLIHRSYKESLMPIASENFQTICIDITPMDGRLNNCPDYLYYAKSVQKIPSMYKDDISNLIFNQYSQAAISVISQVEFINKYPTRFTQNIVYASLFDDGYIHIKSNNPVVDELGCNKIMFKGIFTDPFEAGKLSCENDTDNCSGLDSRIPMEERFIIPTLEYFDDLRKSIYLPQDNINNASDDLNALTKPGE